MNKVDFDCKFILEDYKKDEWEGQIGTGGAVKNNYKMMITECRERQIYLIILPPLPFYEVSGSTTEYATERKL